MKKLIMLIFLLILFAGGFLFYRSKFQATLDKDGNPLRYTFEELDEAGITGVFVLNKDGTFSPAIRSMPGYEGEVEDANSERYLWYVEEDKNIDELIPTVTNDSKLVIVYNVDGDLPESYYLERYAMRGYSIGAHIFLTDDKKMFLSAEEPLEGSQANAVLSQMESNTDDIYEIGEISGAASLPIQNVDPNMKILLGLEKDKLYDIKYYQGTKEREATFKADTKVFQSEKYIPISTPYKKTEHGYFIVNLPQNLSDGYYYLSDIGFFAYRRN